jgi:hypothetical protein
VRVFRPPTFIDKAETAIEGGSADIQEAVICGRLIPSQRSLTVRQSNNHAVIERGLTKEDLPRPKGNNLATEFPQCRLHLGAIARRDSSKTVAATIT